MGITGKSRGLELLNVLCSEIIRDMSVVLLSVVRIWTTGF